MIIKDLGQGTVVRDTHLLATAEEENQRVQCVDEVTGEELLWS